MWQYGWEGNLGENGYKYIYGWVPLKNIKTWLISYTPLQNKKLKKYTLHSCVTRASAVVPLWTNLPYCKEEGGPITVRLWPGNVGWCPLGPDKMQSLGEGGTKEVQVIQISVLNASYARLGSPSWISTGSCPTLLSGFLIDSTHSTRGSPIANFLSSPVCAGGYEETPFPLWATRWSAAWPFVSLEQVSPGFREQIPILKMLSSRAKPSLTAAALAALLGLVSRVAPFLP